MKVRIADYTGKYAVTLIDGQQVYEQILPALESGCAIELDFGGVEVFASPFFNAALGQLLGRFSSEKLNELIEVTNLGPDGKAILTQVLENAREYYAASDEERRKIDTIVSEQVTAD